MTRTWKMFGLQTVLAAALAANPITARADENNPDIKDLARRLAVVESALSDIQMKAEAIQKEGRKIKALKDRLDALGETLGRVENQLDALAKGPAKERVSAYPPQSVDDINKRLDRIEAALERLDRTTRVSKAPPSLGRILLTNRYAEEMTFLINGNPYAVAPGTARMIDGVPAGSLTYEVRSDRWGVRALKTTTLQADETFRITVD